MTKLCRQYIYQVKLLLPTVGKAEKKYLATLANNLEDFCKDTSPGEYPKVCVNLQTDVR